METQLEKNWGKKWATSLNYEVRLEEHATMIGGHYITAETAYQAFPSLKAGIEVRYKTAPDEEQMRYALFGSARTKWRRFRASFKPEFLYEVAYADGGQSGAFSMKTKAEIQYTEADLKLYVATEPAWIYDESAFRKDWVRLYTGFEYRLSKSISYKPYYLAQWSYKKNGTPLKHVFGSGLLFRL